MKALFKKLNKSTDHQAAENILKPVTLSGVIVPWQSSEPKRVESEYKLVCDSGLEYYILADSTWVNILSWYSWEDVKVIGLLNVADMTLTPQKIYPKGPTGEKENVLDIKHWLKPLPWNEAVEQLKSKLTGILIPCFQERNGRIYRFKLGTESDEVLIEFARAELSRLARLASWDEVVVKGHFAKEGNVFRVESLKLLRRPDSLRSSGNQRNSLGISSYLR